MMSFNEAYEIVLKVLKVIAGKATPEPKANDTLEQLGMGNNQTVSEVKNQIVETLKDKGYEFQKMGLTEINSQTKVNEIADTVKHAVRISTPRMY